MKTGFASNALPMQMVPLRSEHAQSLGRHLRDCKAARGWPASAWLWIERLHTVVAPRFVTTVFAASVVLAVCTAWA